MVANSKILVMSGVLLVVVMSFAGDARADVCGDWGYLDGDINQDCFVDFFLNLFW